MKRSFLLCCILLILSNWVCAQFTKSYNKSIHISTEALWVKGDHQEQSPAIRYSVLYSQPLANTRWTMEAGLSFTSRYTRDRFYTSTVFWENQRTQLATVDVSFLFNVINQKRHTVAFGAGPSLWFLRNGNTYDVAGQANQNGDIETISYRWVYTSAFNVGLNLRTTYTYALTDRLQVGARLGVGGNLFRSSSEGTLYGTLSTIGLSAGYRF